MGEPMAMDGGIPGLNQSQHHPLAGQSQFAPIPQTQTSDTPASTQGDVGDLTTPLIQRIQACVIPGKEDEVSRLLRDLRDVVATTTTTAVTAATAAITPRSLPSDSDPVTIGQLKTILQETLQRPAAANPQRPSYASVARQHIAAPTGNFQIIPERRTRELRIRAEKQTEDLARRSAVEVVSAVNTTLAAGEVIATRRLPSGDIILTFQDEIPKAVTQDQGWVVRVFGDTARLHESEFTVISKGLPASRITRVTQDQLLKDIQQRVPEVIRLKVEPPRTPTATYTTAILHLRSADAATRLCERGLVWEAQIFNCEPYSSDLRIRRCFRCHQFGHIGRFCKNKPRCGHCAGAAHPQGEADCPQAKGQKKCVNCGGPHAAWDRQCPKALDAKEQAHVAYQHRPRQFEVLKNTNSRAYSVTPVSSQDSEDDFQIVRSKRIRTVPPTQSTLRRTSEAPARRGRPPNTAIDRVNIQSRNISQMFSQGSSDAFQTQETPIPSTQL
jgi:hypothetical protein